MRIRNLFLAAILPAAIALVGCGPTSNTGGTPKSTDPAKATDKAGKFQLEGPSGIMPYGVKQGETKEYTVTVKRDGDFKQDVVLSFEGPKELGVEMADKKVAASTEGRGVFKVKVDDKAPVGEHTIKVMGKPEKGDSVTLDLKFKVEAK